MINVTIIYNSKNESNRFLEQFEDVLRDKGINVTKHDMADRTIPLHIHFSQIKENKSDIYLVINTASFELRTESNDWSLNHIYGLKVLVFSDKHMDIIPSPQKLGDDREQLAQLVCDVRYLEDNDNLSNAISDIVDGIIKEAEL